MPYTKPNNWIATISKKVDNITTTDKNLNSLHCATRPLLVLCRWFGIFPVTGMTDSSHTKLRFIIKSPYSVICVLSVVGQVAVSLLSVVYLFINGNSPRYYYKALVNVAGTTFTITVLRLAAKWPQVVHKAAIIEDSIPKFQQDKVSSACNWATGTVFLCALVEYTLSFMFYLRIAEACGRNESLMDSYYRYTLPWAAEFVSYSHWVFVIIQVYLIQIIFVSNFADILIMLASLYLTRHFKEFNKLIVLYKDKYPNIWNVIRAHYTRLTRLVKLVDDNLSPFVFLSFGGNLAIICVHLFKILRKGVAHSVSFCDPVKIEIVLSSLDRAAYFIFAISFMITRTLVTALLAGRLHTTARASISVLYEVPTACYSGEAHRLFEQMHSNTVALSGLHFFYVTQKMILGMAATIATYELVLLQFSDA